LTLIISCIVLTHGDKKGRGSDYKCIFQLLTEEFHYYLFFIAIEIYLM